MAPRPAALAAKTSLPRASGGGCASGAAPWPPGTRCLSSGRPGAARRPRTAAPAAAPAAAEATAAGAGAGGGTEALRARLQLHNTMARGKQPLRPRPGMGDKLQMYVCGVTVYDYSHIGGC
jgi:hypothetical protein